MSNTNTPVLTSVTIEQIEAIEKEALQYVAEFAEKISQLSSQFYNLRAQQERHENFTNCLSDLRINSQMNYIEGIVRSLCSMASESKSTIGSPDHRGLRRWSGPYSPDHRRPIGDAGQTYNMFDRNETETPHVGTIEEKPTLATDTTDGNQPRGSHAKKTVAK